MNGITIYNISINKVLVEWLEIFEVFRVKTRVIVPRISNSKSVVIMCLMSKSKTNLLPHLLLLGLRLGQNTENSIISLLAYA